MAPVTDVCHQSKNQLFKKHLSLLEFHSYRPARNLNDRLGVSGSIFTMREVG